MKELLLTVRDFIVGFVGIPVMLIGIQILIWAITCLMFFELLPLFPEVDPNKVSDPNSGKLVIGTFTLFGLLMVYAGKKLRKIGGDLFKI